MNSRLRLIFLALLLLGLNHLAQAQIVAPPKSLLEQSKEDAVTDLSTVNKDLADESHKKADYDACKVTLLKIRQEYDQWFIDHYPRFQELSAKIDSEVESANLKLTSLLDQTVRVNPLFGQKTDSASEVEIKFSDLIDYYTLFNERLKASTKDGRTALLRQMEDPALNDLHIAHSQVKEAMQLMTVKLNASLRQSGATYEITFIPSGLGYQLAIQITFKVNGVSQAFAFSLLQNASLEKSTAKAATPKSEMKTEMKWISSPVQLNEEQKWKALSAGEIDSMPVDAMLRYRQVQDRLKDSCQNLTQIVKLQAGVPFMTYASLEPTRAALKKQNPDAEDAELGMRFVMIEPGPTPFIMGYSDDYKYIYHYRRKGEQQHEVVLSPYEIQTTEVTQAQWLVIMGNNPSYFKKREHCPTTYIVSDYGGICPNNPVDSVSWNDVQDFIKKLNTNQNWYTWRLPTEAEWEFAAKAGTSTVYPFGNDPARLGEYSWWPGNSAGHSHEVGTKKANQFGLFDLLGNVGEWVQDRYDKYRTSAIEVNPQGPSKGNENVVRGGFYGNDKTPSQREGFPSYWKMEYVGFRLARTPR